MPQLEIYPEKREVQTCPNCGKRGFLGYFYKHNVRASMMCCACNWKGMHDDVGTYVYEYRKEVHYTINYQVVDDIVVLFYGPGYSFIKTEQCQEKTGHNYVVDGDLSNTNAYDKIAAFREIGNFEGLTNADILNILCQDGWLDPGHYHIEVQ